MPKKATRPKKVKTQPVAKDHPEFACGLPVVGETGDKAAWIVETPEGNRQHVAK